MGEEQSGELTEDDLFEVLSNRRRRYAVHALKDEEEGATIGDVAEQVAAWEYDTEVEAVSYDERKRVYTALQQSHLPKMDEAGVVDYDKDRGTVEPTEVLEDVDVYLDVVRGRELPWSEYYLGLSAVSASLLAAIWIDVPLFSVLSDVSWAVVIVAAFATSSAIHTYYAQTTEMSATDEPPELDYR
ncbi:DUF7344 domain-containing protein [Halarchaeum nitratireducens]|uniref:DUF7344 domain-containing protein n=1 Tax=Halarchaeum nitratireducens TaxID=489913 RepID=A0A830GD47_9EURY|nr:hypothetical protein GCM10009021_25460 [Halarchaeum nitratireducens]